MGDETAIFADGVSDLAAALPAGSSRACNERGASGMRKILTPAISGNHSAASGYTEVRTAAGTSPPINRLIALVWPLLSWTSVAPAAAIAVLTLSLDADCLSSIAIFLLVRSVPT
jgi:hypothetical protein